MKGRERRARDITEFFIETPLPLIKIAKIYYPFRSYRLLKRVFGDKNEYIDSDLEAWEYIIKKMKKQQNKNK